MQGLPEDVKRFIDDTAYPVGTRFALQRLAEALDPIAPLLHSAPAHNDPRILARDLTAAITWFDSAGASSVQRARWGLLIARLRRLQDLIRHDQAMRRWYAGESAAFMSATEALPSNPKAADWGPRGALIATSARALRDALLHGTAGYRGRLTGTVAAAFPGTIVSAEAVRRLDERIGLLASMLLDEGHNRDDVLEALVGTLRRTKRGHWQGAVKRALSTGWREYEVAVAASGLHPHAWRQGAIAGVRPIRLGLAAGLLRRNWPIVPMLLLLASARRDGADTLVMVRTRARDVTHAVRIACTEALRVADHQSAGAPQQRPQLRSVNLVRLRDDSEAHLLKRPSAPGHERTLSHEPVTVSGSISFLRRAVGCESDVERVLLAWIGLESWGVGRGTSDAPQKIIARELPDFAWLMASRITLLHPLRLLADERAGSPGWRVVHAFLYGPGGAVDGRWLDLLAGTAPDEAQLAFAAGHLEASPLTAWRVDEARTRLLNGKLFVQQLNRHRRETAWALNRTREARNTIAHAALSDPGQMSVDKALRRTDQLPTDARVLGRFAVGLLSELGAVACSRLNGQPGQVGSAQGFLRSCSRYVAAEEPRLTQTRRGERVRRRVAPVP